MKSATLFANEIEAVASRWPCHGLPGTGLGRLHCTFDDAGNLVDYVAYYHNGRRVAHSKMLPCDQSGILSALINDAGKKLGMPER